MDDSDDLSMGVQQEFIAAESRANGRSLLSIATQAGLIQKSRDESDNVTCPSITRILVALTERAGRRRLRCFYAPPHEMANNSIDSQFAALLLRVVNWVSDRTGIDREVVASLWSDDVFPFNLGNECSIVRRLDNCGETNALWDELMALNPSAIQSLKLTGAPYNIKSLGARFSDNEFKDRLTAIRHCAEELLHWLTRFEAAKSRPATDKVFQSLIQLYEAMVAAEIIKQNMFVFHRAGKSMDYPLNELRSVLREHLRVQPVFWVSRRIDDEMQSGVTVVFQNGRAYLFNSDVFPAAEIISRIKNAISEWDDGALALPNGNNRGASANARMIDTMQHKPESKFWTARQWAEALGYKSRSTIKETPTWKELESLRASRRAERRLHNANRSVGKRRRQ